MDIDEASVVEAEDTPPEILQTLIASVAALAEHVKGKSSVHEGAWQRDTGTVSTAAWLDTLPETVELANGIG